MIKVRKTLVIFIGVLIVLLALLTSPIDDYKQSKNEKVILQLLEDEEVVNELFNQSIGDFQEIIALGNHTFKLSFNNNQMYIVEMEKDKERYTFEIFDLKNRMNMIVGIHE